MAGTFKEKILVEINMPTRHHFFILISAFAALFPFELLESGEKQEAEKKSLLAKKQQIADFIAADSCITDSGCRFIAFGSKPCGGSWEYLMYPASIDTARLFNMISEYNKAEEAYNKKWGIMSDCSVPAPPDSVKCVDGKCTGYYFGSPKP